jgi:hypothetical protein
VSRTDPLARRRQFLQRINVIIFFLDLGSQILDMSAARDRRWDYPTKVEAVWLRRWFQVNRENGAPCDLREW